MKKRPISVNNTINTNNEKKLKEEKVNGQTTKIWNEKKSSFN